MLQKLQQQSLLELNMPQIRTMIAIITYLLLDLGLKLKCVNPSISPHKHESNKHFPETFWNTPLGIEPVNSLSEKSTSL